MTKPLPALLTAFLLAIVAPTPAAANSCASPCGDITVTSDCVTTTVTAEGASSRSDTTWMLVIHVTGPTSSDTYSEHQTGPVVVFHRTLVHEAPFSQTVHVHLYADGALVASESWACV